jgi:phosphoesterase RecJ-like protein
MTKGRGDRVAELIRQEVAKLLVNGIKDPRLGFVSVMDVRMSKDMRYANVYVSLYGSESERKGSLVALRNSEGWMRREVGKHLRMRFTPALRFFPDDTLDNVYKLEEVLEQIHEEQEAAPMLQTDAAGIVEELRKGERFLIVSHVSPDGDAIGSMLALATLLRAMGKRRVSCALSDSVPALYADLPGAKKILGPDDDTPEFDTVVVVDVSTLDRVGEVAGWIEPKHRVLIVDHHLTQTPDGHMGWIDSSFAAAGEMIVSLFDAAEVALDRAAADCAYVAISTDTGGFRYSNTTARSHHIAARLVELGVDVSDISRRMLEVLSRPKAALLRIVLDRLELIHEGHVAHSYVTAEDLVATGGDREDYTGLVNYCSNIEGVRVGILFNAVDAETTKASFRSDRAFNSAHYLNAFGGGGHAAAAGITLKMPLDEARKLLLDPIGESL